MGECLAGGPHKSRLSAAILRRKRRNKGSFLKTQHNLMRHQVTKQRMTQRRTRMRMKRQVKGKIMGISQTKRAMRRTKAKGPSADSLGIFTITGSWNQKGRRGDSKGKDYLGMKGRRIRVLPTLKRMIIMGSLVGTAS